MQSDLARSIVKFSQSTLDRLKNLQYDIANNLKQLKARMGININSGFV